MWANDFNAFILQKINHIASTLPGFNHLVYLFSKGDVYKGLLLMLVFWFLYFRENPRQSEVRNILVLTLFGAFIALCLAWLINAVLPYTPRPYVNDALGLAPLPGLEEDTYKFLFFTSSFPSDTAALYFSIAAGIYFASKPLGICMIIYSLIFIAFPRIYLGIHYPTDIIAGALLGAICVALCIRYDKKQFVHKFSMHLKQQYPGFFHASLFFISFEIIESFATVRRIAKILLLK